jgi:hypothetical protein
VTDDLATFCVLQGHPGTVDAIAIFDGHAWKPLGEMLDLHTCFLGVIELNRQDLDLFFCEN